MPDCSATLSLPAEINYRLDLSWPYPPTGHPVNESQAVISR